MNNLLQPGHHPDADQLSAFAEHALPPHEQQQTLAHLATCADCRALVYLTQQANPVESPQPVPTRRPWFTRWNLALPAAAALACLVVLTIHLRTITPQKPAAPTITAAIEPTHPPLPTTPPAPAVPSVQPSRPSHSSLALSPAPFTLSPAPAQKTPQPLFAPKAISGGLAARAGAPVASPQSQLHGALFSGAAIGGVASDKVTQEDGIINGRVTDQSGAAIPEARITATNTATGDQLTRQSAGSGAFQLSPLQPGKYTVEAAAQGFQKLQQNVEVASQQQVGLNLKLPVGSTSETVTVTNVPPVLETSNATLANSIDGGAAAGSPRPRILQVAPPPPPPPLPAPSSNAVSGASLDATSDTATPLANGAGIGGARPSVMNANALTLSRLARRQLNLPSHLATLSTITKASQTLAIDTAGALFRSDDAGATWHLIPTQWQGHALTLRLASSPPLAAPAISQNKATTTEAKAAPQPAAAPTAPSIFELTTDTGASYTSSDGQTWRRK